MFGSCMQLSAHAETCSTGGMLNSNLAVQLSQARARQQARGFGKTLVRHCKEIVEGARSQPLELAVSATLSISVWPAGAQVYKSTEKICCRDPFC